MLLSNVDSSEFFSKHIELAESRLITPKTIETLQQVFDDYSDMLYQYMLEDNSNCKEFYTSEARGFYIEYIYDPSEEKALRITDLFFGSPCHMKPLSSSRDSVITLMFTKPVRIYMQKLGWNIAVCVKTDKYVIYTQQKL